MSGDSPEKPSVDKLPEPEPAEVPFPAEYTGELTRGADGRLLLSGRRMTPDECAAALQEADKLVRDTYAKCSQRIAEFERVGPFLVQKARERLDVIADPKYGHEVSHIAEMRQVKAEIGRWLPHATEFAPLLDRVSLSMGSALGDLLAQAAGQIRELRPDTVMTDTVSALAALSAIRLAIERNDMEAMGEETTKAQSELEKINKKLASVQDRIDVMAESGFLAGVQVAATFEAITGYIENRNAYLATYLEATDYARESDEVKGIVRRGGVRQAVYGAITVAIGQYGPLVLPKVLASTPVFGAGFAIVDVARTVNEKRKLVEERRRHFEELADARQGRGSVSEMTWLGHTLEDDRDALAQLVSATLEMCAGLQAMTRYPQAM